MAGFIDVLSVEFVQRVTGLVKARIPKPFARMQVASVSGRMVTMTNGLEVIRGKHVAAAPGDEIYVINTSEDPSRPTYVAVAVPEVIGGSGPLKLSGSGVSTTAARSDHTHTNLQPTFSFTSGKYYSTTESAFGMSGAYTATAMVANRIYYLPFYVPTATTFDQIGINVQTAAAATNARLGIFTFDPTFTTATRVLDAGAVSTTATGSVFASISQTLQQGWYWLTILCSGTPTLRSFSPADGFACNSTGTIIGARLTASRAYGTYSTTETADADHATGYLVLMRAA